MPKPRYFEVIIPIASQDFPSHSMAGYAVCSDYVGDGGRHLFFRKPESATPPKERKKRASKAKDTNEQAGVRSVPEN
jgi:hypothetical protein